MGRCLRFKSYVNRGWGDSFVLSSKHEELSSIPNTRDFRKLDVQRGGCISSTGEVWERQIPGACS